ncbi:MAG: glycoside hydrolase family 13 protein [Actinomycetota bacterium]|nr:glycoside hydrolase family 13 protein [Actinomycetota bacterium]
MVSSTPEPPWWRTAVIYQVYVRSFADSDGDGIGDLAGVRSRLGYIAALGVDAVWLNPFYPSPQADAGYDVADYRDVDPMFGTLADFDDLVTDAHDLGLRVIIDVVPNHTSSEHPWFGKALAAAPGGLERARYIFRDGRGAGGELPPNDWQSVFGGSAWTPVPEGPSGSLSRGGAALHGHWYLHLFAPEQPDLDWTNDEVRAEFESILRFWLDRKVDGFRIDVAHGLAKDPALPDLAGRFAAAGPAKEGHPYWDRDEVHGIYRAWRRISDSYPGQVMFVGEAWVDSPRRLARYVRPDELHTAFNFEFLLAPWDADALHHAIDESIAAVTGVGAPPTWVLSNHDVVRHVTRYGGGEPGTRRARAAALLMLALPGGAYVYQGEELGLPEVTDLPDDVRRDPTFRRSGGIERGRDGCRVPLPWSAQHPPFGFGPEDAAGIPWLPQPGGWATLTVERQEPDTTSTLSLYRRALHRRKLIVGHGPLAWTDAGANVLAFTRGPDFACAVNLGPEPVEPPVQGEVELSSGPLAADGGIPADTAVWYTTGPTG